MLPLFDLMMRAQNGAATDAMARQFNLAQEQATRAMAALMPAFSSALKRSAANPYDFSSLLKTFSSGDYTQYFEDMSRAFTPQGIAAGNGILEQIFGSKDVSRAIAAQAAQFTGIGQDVLKQMLPVMADMLMGGLQKQTTGQLNAANPFGEAAMSAMRQWLEATGFAPKKAPEPAPSIFDNPFTQSMQAMFQNAAGQQTAANPFTDNPFTKAMQEWLTPPASPAPRAAAKEEAAAAPNPFADAVNAMFDSGLEVQKNYQKGLESIFETYRGKNGDA